jgi:hypothetical protein
MKLNTEISLLDQNNNNGMTLLGFKTNISAISWRPILVMEEAGVPQTF